MLNLVHTSLQLHISYENIILQRATYGKIWYYHLPDLKSTIKNICSIYFIVYLKHIVNE